MRPATGAALPVLAAIRPPLPKRTPGVRERSGRFESGQARSKSDWASSRTANPRACEQASDEEQCYGARLGDRMYDDLPVVVARSNRGTRSAQRAGKRTEEPESYGCTRRREIRILRWVDFEDVLDQTVVRLYQAQPLHRAPLQSRPMQLQEPGDHVVGRVVG